MATFSSKPQSPRDQYREAFQAVIRHYMEWNRRSIKGEPHPEGADEELGRLLGEHDVALERLIDTRSVEAVGRAL